MAKERYELSPEYYSFNDTLVANLRRIRENAGMNQKEFADRCGFSISTIRKLETYQQKVSAYVVRLYCDECNARITDVMPSLSIQTNLAEKAMIIEKIVDDLTALNIESLELIQVIAQQLSHKSGL